jgi:polyhydroxybutyrate depolymerase
VRALTRLAGAIIAVPVVVVAAACGSSGHASTSRAARTAATDPAATADPCAAGAKAPPARVPGAPLDTVLRVPSAAHGHRAPLVLALHFASGTGPEMEAATRLTPEARREGFVVAYPSASRRHFWSAARDLDRLMRTVDDIERAACIDTSRVYAVGISNGGYMATVLACREADRIAAVTLFAPGIGAIGDCSPSRAVSVLEVHGTSDPIVPYRDSSGRPDEDIPAFIAAWAKRDGCSATPRTQRVSAKVTRLRWPGCGGHARVEHLQLSGGRHIELLPQLRAAGVDPARTAWRFLSAQRLPGP